MNLLQLSFLWRRRTWRKNVKRIKYSNGSQTICPEGFLGRALVRVKTPRAKARFRFLILSNLMSTYFNILHGSIEDHAACDGPCARRMVTSTKYIVVGKREK